MTDGSPTSQETTKAAPLKALLRSPVFWLLLVFDLRWTAPVFDSVTWSNLWIYGLIAAASLIFLSFMTLIIDGITTSMEGKRGFTPTLNRFPKAMRLPFLVGATVHYAIAFIFVPTAEGMFLWLAHGFCLLLLLMARFFSRRA